MSLEDVKFKQQVEDVSSTIKLLFLEAKEDEDELSTIDYLSVYIREYKTHAVYFNNDQLKTAFVQFNMISL